MPTKKGYRKKPIATRRGYVALDANGQPIVEGPGVLHIFGRQRLAMATKPYRKCWVVFDEPQGFKSTEWPNR